MEEIKNTINKLQILLKEQKKEINMILNEKIKEEELEKSLDENINQLEILSILRIEKEIDLIKNNNDAKLIREDINATKSIINEIHKKKFNKKIIKNLNKFISI
tara:strand:- start:2929 stop:3240 length:312 start_codon:yes stop_codon:yes gene_type:complete